MSSNQGDKVSIIIPVYNAENFLAECLDSAVNQTHKNKEIIVINDGSTDGCSKIIDGFQGNSQKITVITTENRGVSVARNNGLDIASGDFIIFLDSDDRLELNALEVCLRAFDYYNTDIVLFNAKSFVHVLDESILDKFDYTRPPALVEKKNSCRDLFRFSINCNKYLVAPYLYMYKFKEFKSCRFFPGVIHEDNLFTTQLLISSSTATAVCLGDELYNRRLRPGSIMTKEKSMSHVTGYFVVAEELLKLNALMGNAEISKPLNIFIHSMIIGAMFSAHEFFKKNPPFRVRKKALQLFLKTNLRDIDLKTFFLSIFPELGRIKIFFNRLWLSYDK